MLHLDTPLSFAILSETCRIWKQSTVSHPKKFVDSHYAATQIFTECFDLVQISQHNGNYRMIPFYWYVHCIGTLLCWHAYDVKFMGCDSHFGTQKNYASTTLPQEILMWSKKRLSLRVVRFGVGVGWAEVIIIINIKGYTCYKAEMDLLSWHH